MKSQIHEFIKQKQSRIRKRNYFLPLISGAIVVFLSAVSVIEPTGEANWSGSPIDGGVGSGGQCSNCHNSPGTTAVPTLSVSATPAFGGSGTNLTYSAGTAYTITVHPISTVSHYGFNCEIMNSQSSTSVANFGTWGTAVSSNCQIYAASGIYPTCASHNASTAGPWSFKWTAPASGTGFLYTDVLATNNDGSDGGDHVSVPFCYTLTPVSTAGIETNQNNEVALTVFPNPAVDNVTVNIGNTVSAGTKTIELYDINGKLVLGKNTDNSSTQLDLTSLSKGTYFVKVSDDSKKVVAVKMIMVAK
jgi:type IX secretion system substrate protein